ncbi:hypothetical protein ACFQ1Q_11870 [Winogradskyella litorisediminis]|uniref:HMA domain-containing protein n=1 Tax=Winogradskyella litorisediminis TaxID=1156618 RepID=A0ABW3NC63_9FLAO
MQKKWYFFTFVFSLIGLGLVQQYHNPKANQEIVIQFEDNFTEEETQHSLNEISSTLNNVGVEAIAVTSVDGLYRISYYSNSETHQIKKLLSETVAISFNNDSKNNQSEDKSYNFDVLNIEQGISSSWDFEAAEVYTLNLKSDRSFNPDVFKFPVLIEAGKLQIDIKVAYNACKHCVFVADNTSYNIPEVRAGPMV